MKRNTIVQWINQLPLLCEKPDAILLVLMGLTTGRLAGRYVAI